MTNKNPFTVHYLEVFSPEDPDRFYLSRDSLSNDKIHVGFLDETAWIIDKLGPGETLVINVLINIESGGKSELSLRLSQNFPPYEYKSYEKTSKKQDNTHKLNKMDNIKKENINLSNEKTSNPILLLMLSIFGVFVLNIRNRK